MHPADALRSTARATPPAPERPPPRAGLAAIVGAIALIVGLGLGIAIGRGGSERTAAPPVPAAPAAPGPAPAKLGQLGVSSQPTDGNVTVDGRFVGVTPIERLDLDPGKHSIVIDAFGYQPYAGTLAIEAHGKVNLKVLLAPIGGTGTTSGNVTGPGKATAATVPATALAPPAAAGSAAKPTAAETKPAPARKPARAPRHADPDDEEESSSSSAPPQPVFTPPPRPRRDCSGEKYRCRDTCSRAENSCRFDCPTCVSCSSSIGTDKCRQMCDTCRASCDQNVKFCQTTCDGQYDNCQASQ